MAERKYARLSALTRRIEALLRPAYSRRFWIKAEIGAGNERNGAFYGEVVESTGGEVVAAMQLRIWSDELSRIRKSFSAAELELSLEPGTVIGAECILRYHPRHGLYLQGLDMDPAVVLGELELRRRKIIERLTHDGLLTRNAALPVPRLPLRIALITSRESAAYRDFVETVGRSGFGFRTWLIDAPVQGNEVESLVVGALRRAARLPVDIVVIVRGGGSKLDLAGLDNEAIARSVAAMQVPVWTGIGHETDISLLDHVAGRAFKTPTAVAEEFVARARAAAALLDEGRRRLETVWRLCLRSRISALADARVGLSKGSGKLLQLTRSRLRERGHAIDATVSGRLGRARSALARRRHQLETQPLVLLRAQTHELIRARATLARSSRRSLARADESLARTRERLRSTPVLTRIGGERRTLEAHSARLGEADPRTALRRGFALLHTRSGQLLRSVHGVEIGDAVTAELGDGRLGLDVKSKAEEEDQDGQES